MTKIVYNACYGGFGLSNAALNRYKAITGVELDCQGYDLARHDPALVQVVEELGDAANGFCSKLRIADLPSGTQYRIDEYDGMESVETRDSYDWVTAP